MIYIILNYAIPNSRKRYVFQSEWENVETIVFVNISKLKEQQQTTIVRTLIRTENTIMSW